MGVGFSLFLCWHSDLCIIGLSFLLSFKYDLDTVAIQNCALAGGYRQSRAFPTSLLEKGFVYKRAQTIL